jgi:chromosome segregation ATPase
MKQTIDEQTQTAANLLAQLGTEQAEFQTRMTAAVDDGDSKAMIDLKRRQSELPIEIELARIQIAKLELQADEAKLPELQAEVGKFSEPIQELIEKRDAAVLELGKLQGAYHGANEDLRDIKIRIGERKRELQKLIYLANPSPRR